MYVRVLGDLAEFPTLFRVDREVRVDVARVFPAGGIRKDELPLWVKACGLLLSLRCRRDRPLGSQIRRGMAGRRGNARQQRQRTLPASDAAVATARGANRRVQHPEPSKRGIAQVRIALLHRQTQRNCLHANTFRDLPDAQTHE